MKAEIISTGTELLLGDIVDTNTPFLASQLALLGIDLYFTSSVGDNYKRLLEVLRLAWQRSELIITTGGLGPTQGDITREVIADLVGERIEINSDLRANLLKIYTRRGQNIAPNSIKQASLIPSASAIPNLRGTAPGWWVEKNGRIIIVMPGPPSEMRPMWQNEVVPKLQQKAGAIILSRTIKTFGLGESRVDELLTNLLSSSNPTLATYHRQDGVHLRITAKAEQHEEALMMISNHEAAVRAVLGDYIWGVNEETLESVVGQLLVTKGLSLAVAESFTGGFLINILSSIPQNYNFFKGGLITTSDDVRVTLGINPSLAAGKANVEATTAAMASLVRCKMNASIGIGIDGYTELIDNVMTGKVFTAIDNQHNEQPVVHNYSGRNNQVIISRAAYSALFDLKQLLTSA